jgi:8-oxo-dGTP diphosphatase
MTRVHVAVGVIVDSAGLVLISKRHDDSHQGGLWEFPGGKVEAGETVQEALARELQEELGICIGPTQALMDIRHDYSDKSVHLDVWRVEEFTGSATAREGQPLRWVAPDELDEYAFPAANEPIVERLRGEG